MPDTVLGSGPTNASGQFNIALNPPLAAGDCVYAHDTCTDLVSAVRCAFPPAPAPALSLRLTILSLGLLSLVAALGLARRRRASQ